MKSSLLYKKQSYYAFIMIIIGYSIHILRYVLFLSTTSLINYDHERHIIYYNEQQQNNNNITTSSISSIQKPNIIIPRLLIVQYTGISRNNDNNHNNNIQNYYDILLNLTSYINQVYCIKWKHDYMIFRGIHYLGIYQNESCGTRIDYIIQNGIRIQQHQQLSNLNDNTTIISNDCPYNYTDSRATYNKIYILETIINDKQYKGLYDRVLILDSDAMMYDFNRNIATSFIPLSSPSPPSSHEDDSNNNTTVQQSYDTILNNRNDMILVAHKTNQYDTNYTGSINIGVTLWNLQHPLIQVFVNKWKIKTLSRMRRYDSNNHNDDDQGPLQFILKSIPDSYRHHIILATYNELGYGRGTFIKHYIRSNFSTWNINNNNNTTSNNNTNDDIRLNKVRTAFNEICYNNSPICEY